MDKILRIDMTNLKVTDEPYPEEWQLLGGRALSAKIMLKEVDPIAAAQPYFAMVAANRLAPERLQQEGLYTLLTLGSLVDRRRPRSPPVSEEVAIAE